MWFIKITLTMFENKRELINTEILRNINVIPKSALEYHVKVSSFQFAPEPLGGTRT